MASSTRSNSLSRRSNQKPPIEDIHNRELLNVDSIVKAIEELQTKSSEYDCLKLRVDQMTADIEEIKNLINNKTPTVQSNQSSNQAVPPSSAINENSTDLPLEKQTEGALKNMNDVVEKILSERRILLIQLEDKEKEVESLKRSERQVRRQVKQLQDEQGRHSANREPEIPESTRAKFENYEMKIKDLELQRDNLRCELDQEKRNLKIANDETETHKQASHIYKQDFEEERKAREKLASELDSMKAQDRTPLSPSSVTDRAADSRERETRYNRVSSGSGERYTTRTAALPNRFSEDYSSFMAGGIHKTWICKHCSNRNPSTNFSCSECSRMRHM